MVNGNQLIITPMPLCEYVRLRIQRARGDRGIGQEVVLVLQQIIRAVVRRFIAHAGGDGVAEEFDAALSCAAAAAAACRRRPDPAQEDGAALLAFGALGDQQAVRARRQAGSHGIGLAALFRLDDHRPA
jgi:hypothetical protein